MLEMSLTLVNAEAVSDELWQCESEAVKSELLALSLGRSTYILLLPEYFTTLLYILCGI